VRDDEGHEDAVVSETATDSGGIDLDAPQEWNVEPEETETVPNMTPSAPHFDAEQLDLSDDAASDRHASIQEGRPNVEVPDTWSADHLAEMQKADPEIGIIYRWLEEGKVPSRDDVLRHGAGVKGYAAQWKSLVLIHNVIYRLFEHPAGGTKFYQLLTPRALREELLQLVHAGAASHWVFERLWNIFSAGRIGSRGELIRRRSVAGVRCAISIQGVNPPGRAPCKTWSWGTPWSAYIWI